MWKAPLGVSADGNLLVYTVMALSATANADIMVLDLETGAEPTPFLAEDYNEIGGFLSPDGSKLLFAMNATGRVETYVATFPVPERRWQISNSGGFPLGWTGDGKEILFREEEGDILSVGVEQANDDFLIGAPTPLFDASRHENLQMTLNGQTFCATKHPEDMGIDTITLTSDWLAATRPEGR
jgi:hypothetical protein